MSTPALTAAYRCHRCAWSGQRERAAVVPCPACGLPLLLAPERRVAAPRRPGFLPPVCARKVGA